MRARVFAAWTDISQAALWWVPKGCTLIDCAMELRVGGAWRRRMRRSDGGIVTKHGVYREIVPPERLVSTYNTEYPDGRIDSETVVTITLAEIGGRTRLTLQHVNFATEALAARLCGYGRASMWSPAGALARWQLVEAEEADPGESPPLRVDPYVLQFLQGSTELDPELLGCASYVEARAPLPRWPVEEVSRRVYEALGRGMPSRVLAVGQRLSGRRTFAACVARRLGSPLVAVDTSRVGEQEWRLADRPWRVPHSYTLRAVKRSA